MAQLEWHDLLWYHITSNGLLKTICYVHIITVAVLLAFSKSTGLSKRRQRRRSSKSRQRNIPSGLRSNALVSPSSSVDSISSLEAEEDAKITQENDQHLQVEFPDATPAERKRFLVAKNGRIDVASASLRRYLDWVKYHDGVAKELNLNSEGSNDTCSDFEHWKIACSIALKASGMASCQESVLPRVIQTHQIDGKTACDLQNKRILYIIPAKMDDKLATTSTYALATALYINRVCSRSSDELVTVFIDVRAGRGWPNVHAMWLVPFMQQTATLLLSLFPERLHRCLVFPLPSTFLWIWNAIRPCIDPATRNKIFVLSGPNKIEAPPPFEQLVEHVSEEVAEFFEKQRVESFQG